MTDNETASIALYSSSVDVDDFLCICLFNAHKD